MIDKWKYTISPVLQHIPGNRYAKEQNRVQYTFELSHSDFGTIRKANDQYFLYSSQDEAVKAAKLYIGLLT